MYPSKRSLENLNKNSFVLKNYNFLKQMDLSIKQSNLFIEMQIPKCWDERKTETQGSQMFICKAWQSLSVIM